MTKQLSEKALKAYNKMEPGKEYSSITLETSRVIMNQLLAAKLVKRRLVQTNDMSLIENGVVYRRVA